MKAKIFIAALASVGSAAAMAQLNPQAATSYQTFYIGGASALSSAVTTIVPTLFATGTQIVTINQTTSTNALTAYYGLSNATYTGTSQPLLVIFNSTNGAFAGLGQLIYDGPSSSDPWFESKVLQIGASGDALTCNLTGTATASLAAYTCTSTDNSKDAFVQIDIALLDTQPDEGYPGILTPGENNNLAFNQLTVATTGLQGFGIAVNPALYSALQTAQGLTAGSLTAANQPNILSADFASLISETGAIKSAADLFQNSDQTLLTVVGRTFDSGTQAAGDIYFLNNVCGTVGFGGSQQPIQVSDGGANGLNPGFFNVIQEESTANAVTDLTGANTAGYAIGVVTLTKVPSASATSWQFVKLDGISPNYSIAGVADSKQRNAFTSGAYKFALDMSAAYRKTTTGTNLALDKAVVAGLQNSTLHNLSGIGYLDNPTGTYTQGGQQTRYDRNSNNCSPLIDYNF